jgi:formylglycine-generating enzyme required for sulfatase activity
MKTTKAVAVLMFMAGCWALAAGAAGPATQPSTSTSQPSTQPAKELTLHLGNKVTMKLVLIPAGKFLMGSPKDEADRRDDEGPQHEVKISKPFYMGVYEVTQEQYEQIVGKNPSSGLRDAQNPVETVSWEDAVAFCKKFSALTGRAVRLPTEAQWEYACRAGSATQFGFGGKEEDLSDYAWWGHDKGNGHGCTHAVGQKKPNNWGLYDMHGNVSEWCADAYDKDYYAKAENTDPQGPALATIASCAAAVGGTGHMLVDLRTAPGTFPTVKPTSGGFALSWT